MNPATSAEVVAFGNTNDPDECGGGVSYCWTPDFGTVTFTRIKVTDTAHNGAKP